MAVDRSQFDIAIKSTADLAAMDATIAKLQGQIEATQKLGKSTADLEKQLAKAQQSKIEAALAGITGKMQEGGKAAEEHAHGVEKLGLSHRQLHGVLDQVAPSIAGIIRYMTSGFAGAIGLVLIAFEYLNKKVEEFNAQVESLSTGPGARGEWAEKMRDNVRDAAVEQAVFNEKLRETAERQDGLSESTDRVIEAQKRQAADAKALGDAQKELDLARLALAEKLGQVTPDQAVMIRLQIDDAAFKRQLEAEKAAIQAELSARQQELAANENREPELGSAMDRTGAAALAAKNAQDKNEAKLAQEKEKLEKAKESAAKSEEILLKPHHWGDKADTFMREQAEKNEEQQQGQIAASTRAIAQMEGKRTALAEAAAVAKEQAEKAKSDYEEAAKLSADVLKTVNKLKADLAASTAKNAALENIHEQTSAAQRGSAQADAAVHERERQAREFHAVGPRDQESVNIEGARGQAQGSAAVRQVQSEITQAFADAHNRNATPEALNAVVEHIKALFASQVEINAQNLEQFEQHERELSDLSNRLANQR